MGIARISTENQDEKSLADQEALYRAFLDANLDIPYELEIIAGRGSGELLDRVEVIQATEAVATGQFELVIMEDLGRLMRRAHAQLFCEHCEDHETRLIALNDQVDTANDNWRIMAGFASMRHELHNADTSKRIRRSLRNRFLNGEIIPFTIYGYKKPPGAKHDSQLQKDPAAEPIILEIFRQLEDGATYGIVADWLNSKGIATGPYSRAKRWTGSLVGQFIRNPILKGVRVRNRMMSRRNNSTGRRRSVRAPESERLERHVPHLAFVDPERYDRLIAMLTARNAHFRRGKKSGVDSRSGVPRKRTLFPGQHIVCGVCGRPYYWGGHGQMDHMVCSGARNYLCWNSATFDGDQAAKRLSAAILEGISALPEFDESLREHVRLQIVAHRESADGRHDELARQSAECERQIINVTKAISDLGGSTSLLERLRELEAQKTELVEELHELTSQPDAVVELPTMEELKKLARDSIERLAVTDPEFGRLMQRIAPRIEVRPFRLLDGGGELMRAKVYVNLAPLLPRSHRSLIEAAVRYEMVVDLFDPPQRAAFRERVVELRASGMTERTAARELGITITAAQKAMNLHRLMIESGLTDALVLKTEPRAGRCRPRRHLHPRFRFEPLDGYPRW